MRFGRLPAIFQKGVFSLSLALDKDNAGGREKPVPLIDGQFRIRRFRLAGGEDIKIYCKLVKFRPGPAATFSLYEDNRGLTWLDIAINDQSYLIAATDTSFEQLVAEELLTLGFNKYSG